MAIIYQNTDIIVASGNTIELSTSDFLYIAEGTSIVSTAFSGSAVRFQSSGNWVEAHGTLFSGFPALYDATFGGQTILIGETGRVSSVENTIVLFGGDQTLVNLGHIYSTNDTSVTVLLGGDNLNLQNHSTIIELNGGDLAVGMRTSGVQISTTLNTGLISSVDGDAFNGGSGLDTLVNRGLIVGDIDLEGGNDLYFGRWGTVEGDILLGAGDDTASGGAEDERIEGGFGIDRIFGFGGDDNLFGDSGNDVLRGGDGDDGLNGGIGNDDLGGGAGDDVLLGADGNDLLRGDDGADVMHGGSGYDRASYRDSKEGITLDLADTSQSTGFAEGDSYVSIEAYEATNFNDIMFGDDVNNLLRGYDGDDQISGRGGNDNLQGFDGDDILSGGTGNDTLNGGDGTDVAAFTGDLADYTFTLLGNGNIRVEDTVGSDGIDVLIAVEFVTFGGGAEIDVTGLI